MSSNPMTGSGRRLGAAMRRRGRVIGAASAILLSLLISACGSPNQGRAAAVLIDISGEYAHEMDKARKVTSFLLAGLNPGDSIGIAFIDNTSYTDRNFIARADFDHRPSVAMEQKRTVRAELDAFLQRFSVPSAHSDLTGGVLLARDFLRNTEAANKQLFILSDLQEDLPPRLDRDMPLELDGIEVIAVNVIRGEGDNIDPSNYQQRVARWEQRVEETGGRWQLVNRISRLEGALAQR